MLQVPVLMRLKVERDDIYVRVNSALYIALPFKQHDYLLELIVVVDIQSPKLLCEVSQILFHPCLGGFLFLRFFQ